MPKKRKLLQQQMRGTKKPSQKHKLKEQAQKSKSGKSKAGKSEPDSGPPNTHPQDLKPTIPFSPEDSILLIGEGDLSFSKALVAHHYCENVTATVLEPSSEELTAKYPHAKENVEAIEAEGGKVVYGVDAKKMGPFARKSGKESVGIMDRIIFNFPHVGGKSKDVNRQVRYNQELLVEFFKRALLSLAPGGTIIVTLFEGEPYTLWNIRDLGRHSDLQVERSFRFQASAYPGYSHSRTLGVIKNKQGEVGGGWKGEDRAARTYVFMRKDDAPKPVPKPCGIIHRTGDFAVSVWGYGASIETRSRVATRNSSPQLRSATL
ncbi:hypothetical protein VSDG_03674 [Cytospora chrysosperma]|uniref:25S rRNA (uridine-N(3))-methyltransferase BMT5-like domain-containing protein n=1 Tax=Cytospora chrysosperma TaxID=252740 RepID=A0A423W6G6_CYTCH|nr:hypothetical protein VSDG_03674 [Valsa sordida]